MTQYHSCSYNITIVVLLTMTRLLSLFKLDNNILLALGRVIMT